MCLMVKLSWKNRATTEDCQFTSTPVKGLSFKLINSTNVNHTIIWVENIAKFVSAQGKNENKCE